VEVVSGVRHHFLLFGSSGLGSTLDVGCLFRFLFLLAVHIYANISV